MIKEYRNKDGKKRYAVSVYIGVDPFTGKKKRITKQGFETKKEAIIFEGMKKQEADTLPHSLPSKMTFKELYEIWLDQHRDNVKPSTLRIYKGIYKKHIAPKIDATKLEVLTVVSCQRLLNVWKNDSAPVSRIRVVVNMVLDYGVTIGAIPDNPMKKTKPPKEKDKKEINFYNSNELRQFLECVEKGEKTMFYALFRLLAFTGMRIGEALALTWLYVDLKGLTVSITKGVSTDEKRNLIISTPKTKKSIRTISIDQQTTDILKHWRTIQAQKLLVKGYNSLNSSQLVFSSLDNRILEHATVVCHLNTILKKNNLKPITLHGFRHTHCSLLFEMDTPLQVVQERLGHSNIQTTMNIYAHVTEKARDLVADKFARYINF